MFVCFFPHVHLSRSEHYDSSQYSYLLTVASRYVTLSVAGCKSGRFASKLGLQMATGAEERCVRACVRVFGLLL